MTRDPKKKYFVYHITAGLPSTTPQEPWFCDRDRVTTRFLVAAYSPGVALLKAVVAMSIPERQARLSGIRVVEIDDRPGMPNITRFEIWEREDLYPKPRWNSFLRSQNLNRTGTLVGGAPEAKSAFAAIQAAATHAIEPGSLKLKLAPWGDLIIKDLNWQPGERYRHHTYRVEMC